MKTLSRPIACDNAPANSRSAAKGDEKNNELKAKGKQYAQAMKDTFKDPKFKEGIEDLRKAEKKLGVGLEDLATMFED